jgi:ferredoxin-NADP reductase
VDTKSRSALFEVAIVAVTFETPTIRSYALQRTNGESFPAWAPGAHIDVEIGSGELRQYSLCGVPSDLTTWVFAVQLERQGRGGSAWIHESLDVGSVLRVSPPRNNFPLSDGDHFTFIAGGIGITPLVPMIEKVAARGAAWNLVYGARSSDAFAFRDRLGQLGAERVTTVAEDLNEQLNVPMIVGAAPKTSTIYCCGPAGLIESVEKHGMASGIEVRVERFAPIAPIARGDDAPIEVVLMRSGITVQVSAEESILAAVERAGVEVDWSCSEGTCGTCETTVLDGTPDQRDSVLSKADQDAGKTMMICCSRARTPRLTLDL